MLNRHAMVLTHACHSDSRTTLAVFDALLGSVWHAKMKNSVIATERNLWAQKGAVTVELASGVGSLREQTCLTFRGQVCLIRLTEGAGLL